jgi:hypothetical protein
MLGGQQRATIHAQLKSSSAHLRNSQRLAVMSDPAGHDGSRALHTHLHTHGQSACCCIRGMRISESDHLCWGALSANCVGAQHSEAQAGTQHRCKVWPAVAKACFHWRPMKLQCKVLNFFASLCMQHVKSEEVLHVHRHSCSKQHTALHRSSLSLVFNHVFSIPHHADSLLS